MPTKEGAKEQPASASDVGPRGWTRAHEKDFRRTLRVWGNYSYLGNKPRPKGNTRRHYARFDSGRRGP